MPDEHLRVPKTPDEWAPYHKASMEALGEGEIAERWLREERTRGMGEYGRLAGRQSYRDPKEAGDFDSWRMEEQHTIAATTSVAAAEATTFQRIVELEAQRRSEPIKFDPQLYPVVAGLTSYPAHLTGEDLRNRRNLPDRSFWEVAVCTALQFGVSPLHPASFGMLLNDARLRVRRNAGELNTAFTAFTRATELAVATAYKENLPSATWDQSEYKRRADELREELESWDFLMQTWDNPPIDQMQARAEACSKKLVALALECGPNTALSRDVAFSSLTGTAMLMALAERMTAQIKSRASEPTIQGVYDRLIEIPNRDPADPTTELGKSFENNYDKLTTVWKKEMQATEKLVQKMKGAVPDYAEYHDSWLGRNTQDPIHDALAVWDKALSDPNNLLNQGGLQILKDTAATLSRDLANLRRTIERTGGVKPSSPGYSAYMEAREGLLIRIDTLTGQMERRLEVAQRVLG